MRVKLQAWLDPEAGLSQGRVVFEDLPCQPLTLLLPQGQDVELQIEPPPTVDFSRSARKPVELPPTEQLQVHYRVSQPASAGLSTWAPLTPWPRGLTASVDMQVQAPPGFCLAVSGQPLELSRQNGSPATKPQ